MGGIGKIECFIFLSITFDGELAGILGEAHIYEKICGIIRAMDTRTIKSNGSSSKFAATRGNGGEEVSKKGKVGFNGLLPRQWAALSKNVWNDLSSPRDQRQLEHGAVFPIKLADRLITMYSGKHDAVLDPFAGIGTTLVAAQNLERHAFGIELNPRFAKMAEKWTMESRNLLNHGTRCVVVCDDCRNLTSHVKRNGIQFTLTSPPYANFIRRSVADRRAVHKKSLIAHANNSVVKPYSNEKRDFGNLAYPDFLVEIEKILHLNYCVTRHGGYAAWVVKDYRDTEHKIPYVPFHSDLATIGQRVGFKFHDLIVWDQSGQRRLVLLGFPSVFYTNQNCSFIVIFRKC